MFTLYVIIAIVAVVAFLFFAAAAVFSTEKFTGIVGAVTTAVVFLIVSLLFSVTTVDARAVGIRTDFGRYTETLEPGLQLTAPWSSVEEFTTRLQPANLDGDHKIPVTFKGGGSGWIESTFQWHIDSEREGGAQALWQDYKDFDTVRDELVLKQAKDKVINTANDFAPNDAREKQDVLGKQIKESLNADLARFGVVVDTVSVTGVLLSEKAQIALDKVLESQSNIKRAEEERTRAKIDSETAQIRQKTGALTKQANERFCLDVVNNWDVAKNGPLPATFNCGLGGQPPVLVGAGK